MKVFLCHSSGDKDAVRALYKRLLADGLDPWLDEEDLLPGEEWEPAIEQAVRDAGVVLVCLSRKAGSKRGFVQKEIKFALDVADELPEGTTFIIPAKLEECDVPQRLSKWQWANLVADRGYEKLLRALRVADGLPAASASARYEVLEKAVEESRAPDYEQTITNSIGLELIRIPAGEFQMGAEDGEDREKPVHTIRLTRPFYLAKYPVTQAQWEAVMGKNPSRFTGEFQMGAPVEQVSWDEIQDFLRKLNEKERNGPYRLPTEAEWEYAARAGTTTTYCFGNGPEQLKEYAWYKDNSERTTHPVGQLKANAWGLYDVHGNVWEWVQDGFAEDYYKHSPSEDPTGPGTGSHCVLRGGSWSSDAALARVSFRDWYPPGYHSRNFIGFRCAR